MKKMLTLLIALFVIYFGIQYAVDFFSKGHNINYQIEASNGTIDVHEILTLHTNETNNYFIEIKYDNETIPFKILNTYTRKEKIVRNVTILKDSQYTCAYLTLEGDKFPSDIKCAKNNVAYFYSSIKGQDKTLDDLIDAETIYNYGIYKNNEDDMIRKDNIVIYPHNLTSNKLIMDNYRGVYLIGNKINSNIKTIELFSSDVYDKPIETQTSKYYVVANYNSTHEFNEFLIVNMDNGSEFSIKSDYYISFDSFFEGTVDEKAYLIDRDNKKQYSIDVKRKEVSLIGSEADGAKDYQNGEWSDKNINEIIDNKLTFTTNSTTSVNGIDYDKTVLIGDSTNGTYYAFKANNGSYDVYAIYTQSNIRTYLFTTTDKDRVIIKNDYLYYLDNENLMVFGPDYGIRRILVNSELKYNSKLLYFVY